jgi:hypothetical protein
MEARYIEHAKATAVCVELALGGVAEDIQRELADSSGQLAEALHRLLERVKARQERFSELVSGSVSVSQMIDRLAA